MSYTEIPNPVTETQNSHPHIPGNPNPANGATDTGVKNVQLAWSGGDPDGDDVEYSIYTGADQSPLALINTVLNDTSYIHEENLKYNTLYFWKITAKDTKGATADGPVWSFTTQEEPVQNSHPNIPGSPSPAHEATDTVASNVQLAWSGGDPDGDDIEYSVYLGLNSSSLAVVHTVINDTSYTCKENLEYSTTYYWKITAKDTEAATAEGQIWLFTTQDEPVKPVPSAPSDLGAQVVPSGSVDLVWTDTSDNETGFKIERKIGDTGDYQSVYLTANPYYSDSDTLYCVACYYRVKAYNNSGDSLPSNEVSVMRTTPLTPVITGSYANEPIVSIMLINLSQEVLSLSSLSLNLAITFFME